MAKSSVTSAGASGTEGPQPLKEEGQQPAPQTIPPPPQVVSQGTFSEADMVKLRNEFISGKYSKLPNKSAMIRAAAADGYKRSLIAKALGIRYQHVRNVVSQPLKRPDLSAARVTMQRSAEEHPTGVEAKEHEEAAA